LAIVSAVTVDVAACVDEAFAEEFVTVASAMIEIAWSRVEWDNRGPVPPRRSDRSADDSLVDCWLRS
jgi:hypothetical protein